MPTRKASGTWEGGGLQTGRGTFKGETGAVQGSFTTGSRFAEEAGSNPEELLAAAHAACFSMAFSGQLDKAGSPPERVTTDAACTVEKVENGFKITTMRLTTRAQVPGIEAATFARVAEETRSGCPVSKALTGVEITLDAQLE